MSDETCTGVDEALQVVPVGSTAVLSGIERRMRLANSFCRCMEPGLGIELQVDRVNGLDLLVPRTVRVAGPNETVLGTFFWEVPL